MILASPSPHTDQTFPIHPNSSPLLGETILDQLQRPPLAQDTKHLVNCALGDGTKNSFLRSISQLQEWTPPHQAAHSSKCALCWDSHTHLLARCDISLQPRRVQLTLPPLPCMPSSQIARRKQEQTCSKLTGSIAGASRSMYIYPAFGIL